MTAVFVGLSPEEIEQKGRKLTKEEGKGGCGPEGQYPRIRDSLEFPIVQIPL